MEKELRDSHANYKGFRDNNSQQNTINASSMMSHHVDDHQHFGPVKFSQATNRFGVHARISMNNASGAAPAQKDGAIRLAGSAHGHQNLRTMDASKDNSNLQHSIEFAEEVASGQLMPITHQYPQQRQSLNRPLIGAGQAQTANQNRATQSRPSQYRESNSFPRRPNTNHVTESEYDDGGGVSPYVHIHAQGQGKQGEYGGA